MVEILKLLQCTKPKNAIATNNKYKGISSFERLLKKTNTNTGEKNIHKSINGLKGPIATGHNMIEKETIKNISQPL